jgi:hypothetical protein
MLNETNALKQKPIIYQIKVEGVIDASWSEWLGCIHLKPWKDEKGQAITVISAEFPDQAALRGLLNRLWDLNLVLSSLRQVDPNIKSESEQGGF